MNQWLQLRSARFYRSCLLVVAGLFGLTGVILQYGVAETALSGLVARVSSGAALGLFLVEQIVAAVTVRPWRHWLRECWPTLTLTALLVGEIIVIALGWQHSWLSPFREALSIRSLTRAYLIVIQFYILGQLAVHLPHLHARFARVRIRPGRSFLLVFYGAILAGSGLLLLPRATPPEQPIGGLDALFTATSAVCVTGLVVRDTASQFTPLGQGVLLLLIQAGGLGIMSLTAAFAMLLGRGIGVRESSLLREVFQLPLWAEVGKQLRFIVLMTLSVEAVGTVLLYRGLAGVIPDHSERLFHALFHAVSAFCNAGFSTFDDSLVSLADNTLVIGTISALLILGGLGFTVVAQLMSFLRGWALRGERGRGAWRRLGLQSHIVILMTLVLLLGGAFALTIIEWDGALAGYSWAGKIGRGFFQSATCRTAGFNSIDLSLLSAPALMVMIVLMFIGGGSGSTAGGVKLTTVAVMWANLRAVSKGHRVIQLADREIDPRAVQRALVVISSAAVAAALAIFVLLLSEERGFLETCFEAFSALGTVGLSLGLTADLSPVGRAVVIVLMFIGRLGPLTLAYSLASAEGDRRVRLPRARVMIG